MRPPIASALLGAVLALGCGGSPEPGGSPAAVVRPAGPTGPRDVLLVTVDTLRWDAVGFSGRGRASTPAFDRLAAGGMVFDFAHAHAVVTLPSHASLLTGLLPPQHGIRDNAGYVLPDGIPTLAEVLGAAGYRTGAFVSAYTLDRRYGLDRGFEVYDDAYDGYGERGFTPPERPGDETAARALAWWEEHSGQLRFLWAHVFTPHYPYEPEEPFASRHRAAPYFGDVEMADAELAPLLARAEADGALIVLTSDHGEGLGDHGEATHGLFAYESTLRVPLVLYADGLVGTGRSDAPVRHVDVMPTVLGLLGVGAPGGLAGRPLFADASSDAETAAYFEAMSPYLNRGWAPLRGRIVGHEKAIDLPIPELYDLDADPEERRNLAERQPEKLRRLLDALPVERTAGDARERPDAETIARLRSLGYVADDAPRPTRFDPSTDPKNLVEVDALLDTALSRYRTGDLDGALADLRELMRRQPTMPLAATHLSFLLAERGDVQGAIDVLASFVERGLANESIRRKLALNLLRLDRADEAEAALAPHADSDDPETQSALGRVRAKQGRLEDAERRFRRALELDPTFPTASMDLGLLRMMQGRFDAAAPLLERALRDDPYLAEAWNALGVIRASTGDDARAIEAWRRAVEIDPRLTDVLFNLAVALARRGERAEAERLMRRYAGLVRGDERAEAERWLERLRGG